MKKTLDKLDRQNHIFLYLRFLSSQKPQSPLICCKLPPIYDLKASEQMVGSLAKNSIQLVCLFSLPKWS